MAYEIPLFKATFIAGESLTAKQYCFVKLSAANTVVACAAATDIPIGILQNDPAADEAAEVMMIGISKLSADDTSLTVGALVGTSSDGEGVAIDPDGTADLYFCGQVIEAAAAAHGYATVAINCINPVIQSGS